jgi:hypothetical protein
MKKREITIKITQTGPNTGPFSVYDNYNNLLDENVSRKQLIKGRTYLVDNKVTNVRLVSNGECGFEKTFPLKEIPYLEYSKSGYKQTKTACLWKHLTNTQVYNYFYGSIKPYVIEYPFAYQYQDEILQNVKDYTKAYEYIRNPYEAYDSNLKIETNDKWFNKAILYNGQQSSGILNLVAKPLHNLQAYGQYPIYNTDSKTITYTKSDNFYQYNTFWALEKSSQVPLFRSSCESMSIDKEVNQENMDYGLRSFKKATLRAKELKIRHILDSSSTVHLVSQFILTPSQISYK